MTEHAPPAETVVSVRHERAGTWHPADPQDVLQAMAHALRYQGRRRVDHAGEIIARIAAERIAEHLARSGFMVVRRQALSPGPDLVYAPVVPGAPSSTP